MTHVCRGCHGTNLVSVLNLGRSPLSNDFRTEVGRELAQPTWPLELFVCENCKFLQLPAYVSRENIFTKEYAYFSSFSKLMQDHASNFAVYMRERFGFGDQNLVVEVASNDGYLLQHFAPFTQVLGIEPCKNVAQAAKDKGIMTRQVFFGAKTARDALDAHGSADLLIAFNVLAHVPDIHDFIEGVQVLLAPAGIAVFEFPPALPTIDAIYHEHYSYLSLLALEPIFKQHGLEVFDAQIVPIHGGSYRLFVGRLGYCLRGVDTVGSLHRLENDAKLDKLVTYTDMAFKAQKLKCQLLSFLTDAAMYRERVVGYGAPAKATTLLNYCGIGRELLRVTSDVMPTKVDHFVPGVDVPIVHEDMLPYLQPDHVLILPWNLETEVVPKIRKLFDSQPLPRLWVAVPELRQIA